MSNLISRIDANEPIMPRQVPLYEGMGLGVWLMSMSDLHHSWSLSSTVRLLRPPFELGQAQFYFFGDRPCGFVTWAFLNDECASKFSKGTGVLEQSDWATGGNSGLLTSSHLSVAPVKYAVICATASFQIEKYGELFVVLEAINHLEW